MADQNYGINYTGDSSRAISEIERLIAAIDRLDARVAKSKAGLADFGRSMPGIAQAMNDLGKLGSALNLTEAEARKATQGLKSVGGGTEKITGTATKIGKLVDQLKEVEAHAPAAAGALQSVGGGVGGAGGARGETGGGFGGLAGRAIGAGVRMLRSGFNAVGDAGQDERDYNEKVAEKALAFRAHIKELAPLEGKAVVDDDLVRSQLAFQSRAAMTPEEAEAFRNQYKGAIGSGKIRGNITDKVADEFMPEAATFAVRSGMDMETGGKMAGLLAEYGKVESAQAGMAKLGEIQHNLNVLGIGTMKQLARPFLGLMGEMVAEDGGRVANPEAMSAMYAAETVRAKSPSVAATEIRQSNRVLRKLIGTNGITAEDDYFAALKKVAPDVTGPKGDLWLRDHDLKNDAENKGLIRQAKLIPVIEAQMNDPRAKAAGQSAIPVNEEFRRSLEGRMRIEEANKYAAEIEQGMKSAPLQILRRAAEARLKDPSRPGGPAIDTMATNITDAMTYAMNFSGVYGRDERIDQEVIRERMERAKQLGIPDVDKRYGDLKATTGSFRLLESIGGTNGTRDPFAVDEQRRAQIGKLDQEIEAKEKAAATNKAAADLMMKAASDMANVAAGMGGAAGVLSIAIQAGKDAVVPTR